MITNKDIRVENGNLIINGNKYPLDGQSPEAIMDIVEDNSDSTPTAESTAPVTSTGIKTYVDTAIEGLIISENSTGPIEVNGTFQIPTEMLSKNIIVLSINRASTCGSIALPTLQITQGSCSSGIKILAGYGSDPTTDIYAVLTISTTGLITVKHLNNWSPVYIVLKAI